MNTRSQISRGNKLFLPKIEYARLAEDRSFGGERPNIKPPLGVEEKSNAVYENGEKIPLLNREYDTGSFTRFSVLPPIKDSVRNARRMSRTRKLSTSGFTFNGSSPATNNDTNKRGDETRTHKYVEFSTMLAQQRRGSFLDSANNLEVVGKPYTREKRGKTRQMGHRRLKGRPPERSLSGPVSSEASDTSCKGCQALLSRQRSKTEGEKLSDENLKDDAVIHTCKKKEDFPGPVRSSSDNVYLQNETRVYGKNDNTHPTGQRRDSNLTLKQSGSAGLLVTRFPNGRRPVSRCEISLDVNPPVTSEHESQVMNQRQNMNISPLSVQIDGSENTTHGENTDISPQGTPQIQILIDSLESAREEIPKPGSEVPYTSVREKRRRSALCRNNSKQVDDFLLVHNLRDLGLL